MNATELVSELLGEARKKGDAVRGSQPHDLVYQKAVNKADDRYDKAYKGKPSVRRMNKADDAHDAAYKRAEARWKKEDSKYN